MASLLQNDIIREAIEELKLRCGPLWGELGSAHILLTGGTGYFGSWIITSFIACRQLGFPIRLTVLSRNPDLFLKQNPSLESIDGLQFRKDDIRTATIPFDVTHVLHFATTPAQSADPVSLVEMRSAIIDGTRRILEEAIRVRARRFFLASSGAVYGRGRTEYPLEGNVKASGFLPPSEDLTPGISPYGDVKREIERICFEAERVRRIETVSMRGFAFSGPLFPLDGTYPVAVMMKEMLNGLVIRVKSPSAIRSFLDGRDLAYTIWLLLIRGRSGEAYNVGGREPVSMAELAELIRAAAIKIGMPVPEVILLRDESRGRDIYCPQLNKLETEFGWLPLHTLKESIADYAVWADFMRNEIQDEVTSNE